MDVGITWLLILAFIAGAVFFNARRSTTGLGFSFPGPSPSLSPEIQAIVHIFSELGKKFRKNELENIVIPLGESGAGKTTLVKFLTDSPDADNTESTMNFRAFGKVYQVRKSRDDGSSTLHDVFVTIADYRGQNLGTLFRGLMASAKQGDSELGFHRINTLIFVVDLFAPPVDATGKFEADDVRREMPDEHRISENVNKWSEETLEIIFGSLDHDVLQSICVFINKIDLVSSEKGRARAREAYDPLVERIEKWAQNHPPRILLGSLKTGEGCLQLKEHVLKHSVYR